MVSPDSLHGISTRKIFESFELLNRNLRVGKHLEVISRNVLRGGKKPRSVKGLWEIIDSEEDDESEESDEGWWGEENEESGECEEGEESEE